MSEAPAKSTQALPFITPALSYRFESAEWLPSFSLIERLRMQRPELGAECREIAGGWAFYAGENSPLSHALGMGLHGPVTVADIDAVEALYRGRQSYCEIVVSPYADLSLVSLLGERGYRITEWNSVLVHDLVQLPSPAPPEIEIRRVSIDQALTWSKIVSAGFSDENNQLPLDLFTPFAEAKEAMCFLAFIGGEPVGGAGGSAFPEQGIAPIYGASTLKPFRNRGVQTALIRARLQTAVEAGCQYALVCTMPGSGSQRNVERNGFRVAYTKCAMQCQL